jgi:hypothetical protein
VSDSLVVNARGASILEYPGDPDLVAERLGRRPTSGALTLSDHLLGPALVALPLTALTGSALGAYNLLLLGSFVATALTTHLVLRAAGLGRTAALVGALAFSFSPYRWSQLGHLQILLTMWIGPVLWTWHRLLGRPRTRTALLFLVFYALHVSGACYLAFMIHVPLAIFLAVHALHVEGDGRRGWERLASRRALRILTPTVAVAATISSLIFLPYALAASRLHLLRPSAAFRNFGATLPALLTPLPSSLYFAFLAPPLRSLYRTFTRHSWLGERVLFPGLLPVFLGAVGLVLFFRRHASRAEPPLPSGTRYRLKIPLALAFGLFAIADAFTYFLPLPRSLTYGDVYTLFFVAIVALLGCGRLRGFVCGASSRRPSPRHQPGRRDSWAPCCSVWRFLSPSSSHPWHGSYPQLCAS